MATKRELQEKYEELYGEPAKVQLSKPELEKLILDKEAPEEETKTDETLEEEVQDQEEQIKEEVKPDEEIEKIIASSRKVRDGKRHLVFKQEKGTMKEVWWTSNVIEIYRKSFGDDSLEFPPNTEYIAENIKKCTTCG